MKQWQGRLTRAEKVLRRGRPAPPPDLSGVRGVAVSAVATNTQSAVYLGLQNGARLLTPAEARELRDWLNSFARWEENTRGK